jgi:D-alanyl-D-alanine carboxypeptidase/D-alanyl-D-alanine-endopeptidase (penicillin-binding protein 4)
MSRRTRGIGTAALVLLLAAGAYVTADAYDAVPGLVTLAPAPAPARPFPTAPGAVDARAPAAPLAALDAAAPVPDRTRVDTLVRALVADARVGPSVGVLVADQATGDVLAVNDPDTPRTPASTAKLVTAVAALSTLGPDSKLETRVVRDGVGGVVLVGGGDMMLAAGAGDPVAVNGRAGLADLARQVAGQLTLAGTTTVRLTYNDSLFTGSSVSPGWAPGDIRSGEVAPVTALAVNIARTGEDPGSPRSQSPSSDAAVAFAAALVADGITVSNAPTRGTVAAGAIQLGVVRSATVGAIVDYFLHYSDNTIAEVVARLVALKAGLPGTFEGATAAVLDALRHYGVAVDGARLVDASGLATGSRLSPALLAALLRTAADPSHPELRRVVVYLPVAGLTGTLADRFAASSARGMVRAKTGSLRNVTALAGTVQDADGRLLVFAVIADQTPDTSQTGARAALDGFVAQLAACGCQAG